jgi:hypothetical protein
MLSNYNGFRVAVADRHIAGDVIAGFMPRGPQYPAQQTGHINWKTALVANAPFIL